MNKTIPLFLLAAGVLAVTGAIHAQGTQLYTWTDENGVVHYVDTPPDNPKAVSMEVPEAYLPGSADAYPQAEEDADLVDVDRQEAEDVSAVTSLENDEISKEDGAENEDAYAVDIPETEEISDVDGVENEEVSYADQKREQMAQKREARRKEQAALNQNCASAREQLATMEPSRRVYFTNAQGETERMDDEERVRLVEQAKAEITRNCQ